MPPEDDEEINVGLIEQAIWGITDGFIWAETEDGVEYWRDARRRLERIRENGR